MCNLGVYVCFTFKQLYDVSVFFQYYWFLGSLGSQGDLRNAVTSKNDLNIKMIIF